MQIHGRVQRSLRAHMIHIIKFLWFYYKSEVNHRIKSFVLNILLAHNLN